MKGTFTGSRTMPRGTMFCFKLEDGKSAKTYSGPQFGNFRRWSPLMGLPKGTIVTGLRLMGKHLIDADSEVRIGEAEKRWTNNPVPRMGDFGEGR